MSIDSDLDAEKVLDVAAGASEADVRKAYVGWLFILCPGLHADREKEV